MCILEGKLLGKARHLKISIPKKRRGLDEFYAYLFL
jgi:hypothetical protein